MSRFELKFLKKMTFFTVRIFVYIFFIVHIILSLNKVELFPIFGWNLYQYTHPYATLYSVKIVKEDGLSLNFKDYIGKNKFRVNKILRRTGSWIDRNKFNRNSKEFQKAQSHLENFILMYISSPFSYQLIKQKIHLPFYVLSKKNSIVSEEIVLKGKL